MFKLDFKKAEEPENHIANIHWIIEKAREFQKNIYFCFIDYAKVFDCVDHNKLWKILNGMGLPEQLTCLLSNLYANQEAIVRTRHGTTNIKNWERSTSKLYLSLCLFKFYAEYIIQNPRLDEDQAETKIAGRNVNNHRCADDTTHGRK